MSEPLLSIVITSYCPEQKHYLDLCIESIFRSSFDVRQKAEVILVTRKGYEPRYDNVITCYPEQESFANCVGINYGVSRTNPKSKYLLLMNDDVILTKDAITRFIDMAADSDCMINPITQSDNTVLYQLMFRFRSKDKAIDLSSRFYRYEDLKPYFDDIMNAESVYPAGAILQNVLYMHTTLVPRKVWEKVGPMDENFQTGHDDLDYSIRCHALKIPMFIALNIFTLHFGGVSSSSTQTDDKRVRGIRYFKRKHGFTPPGMLPEVLEKVREAELRDLTLGAHGF